MKEKDLKEWLEQANRAGMSLTSNLANDVVKKINECNYSKRELDDHFLIINEKLDTLVTQTTKTNGRVSILENWRSYIIGGMSVFVVVFGLIAYIWNSNVEDLKDKQLRLTAGLNELSNKIK